MTSKALPDTEIDAAMDPVAVSPTSTAATATDGIIRMAKRRNRTFPAVASRAGWAGVSRESSVFVFSARSATGVTHPR